ncbi:C-type isolectin Sp-CL4-like [Clinocottus analis]|uniref:C-type isolectin Sp-CL4-like n=1 Tax=Clinocottus analis TaxID=304258 RepID=UPI0035C2148F
MRPAVFTAVLLLVGIISTVTEVSAVHPWEICTKLKGSACDEPGWIRFGGSRCMKYFRVEKNFKQAEESCHSMDSELLSIHNEDENNHAMCLSYYSLSPSHKRSFWIEGKKSGDVFKFKDGSELEYTNWHTGEPNNVKQLHTCIQSNFRQWGKWNDFGCHWKNDFVCMKRK